ncbi:hypothetical protein BH10PLA2_BH10PLA2_11700 [soil metagenome]
MPSLCALIPPYRVISISKICFLTCCIVAVNGSAFGQEKAAKRLSEMQSQVFSRARQFSAPKSISVREVAKKEVLVNLEVKMATVEVERPEEQNGNWVVVKDKLRVRTYNGDMIAPVIRATAGDLLKIKLINNISKQEPDVAEQMNKPGGFNITNLHTHVLHVSPSGNSDKV